MTERLRAPMAAWPLEPVIRKLRSLSPLSEAETQLVTRLADRRSRQAPGEELIVEGQAPRPRFLVSGWAAAQRTLPDGRRQIFRFYLPGDMVGFRDPACPAVDCAVVALTALETFDGEAAQTAAQEGRAPGLARAAALSRAQDYRLLLDHLVRLGQQTAYERVAHLLLELQGRLQVAGLGDERRFPLPLTQEILADALGLSIVHVNRTLQQLRREGLIELRSGVAILLQPQVLNGVADYEATRARSA